MMDSEPVAPSPPRLEVRGLRVARGSRRVLEDVSFDVRRGEAFGILGPNGAGKTTCFHILTGLLAPDAGEIFLDGRGSGPADPEFRARVGVVFQSPALDPRLTARENLLFASRLYAVPAADARKRVTALLARAELTERAADPVAQLSGGLKRRLELARALVHDPEILILDEPTTGLDEAAFRRTWADLLALRRDRGLTLLLTTHRPDEAEMCDRLAILDGGRLVACDTPERLRARVRGDLILIETDTPDSVAAALAARLGVETKILDGRVAVERPRGHELVPRLVEALPEGAVRSVSVRRPGLGEAFLDLTGHSLDLDQGRP